MTEPVYTTATTVIVNSAEDDFAQYFAAYRFERQHMLVNSVVHFAEHPTYVRHWTTPEDAQAWVDVVHAFAAEHNFDMQGQVHPI